MRKFLERYGWKRVSETKQGCFRRVLWMDKDGQVYPQHIAGNLQRLRNGTLTGRAAAVVSSALSDTVTAGVVPAVGHDCIHSHGPNCDCHY